VLLIACDNWLRIKTTATAACVVFRTDRRTENKPLLYAYRFERGYIACIKITRWLGLCFSPLGKLARRAIYSACVNFLLFLMIAQITIISGSTEPILAIFSPNEIVLGADDRSEPLFPISQGMLLWQPILWKHGKLSSFVALAFRNGMGYRYLNVMRTLNDASI